MNSLISKLAKSFKGGIVFGIAATLIVSGFFAPNSALAAAIVAPAVGGINISIDTTSAPGGSGVFKLLTGPSISDNGDIAEGAHTISLPLGWEIENSPITITAYNDIILESTTITPGPTSFSFVVTSKSTSFGFLGFSGLKVRPTDTTPSTGNMTYLGAGIVGVDGSMNFGTLSTIPGVITKLAFTTQPGNAAYGSLLNPQPVVKTQDQFGNDSVSGLIPTEMASLTLTGTGVLGGTTSINIGTGGGTPGTVDFTDLKVGGVGAVGTKALTASATDLDSAVSNNFEIIKKPLTATVFVNNKPYDGNNSAVITNVQLNEIETGDDVTVSNQGVATFNDVNANEDIGVTATGVAITGTHAENYDFGNTATGKSTITLLEITITPTAGQTKTYGQADPVFIYTFAPDLISPDTFTGVLGRIAGEDANTYAYTLGTLENGLNNYALTLSGTFEITQKPLTITATGVNKEYDQTTSATVTLSSADEELGDGLVYDYTSASFLTKTAKDDKTVNVSGISISGAKTGNYNLQNTEAVAAANITRRPITATISVDNKTYNGNTNATYCSAPCVPRVANGVIEGDIVVVENTGAKTFVDKHTGIDKPVSATGLTLSGVDAENYDFNGTGTGMATINARQITVTAVINGKVYDGTINSSVTPAITSPNSPPVVSGDTANFIQTYDNKNVGSEKTLTPGGTVNDGNDGNNYLITLTPANIGVITQKTINVTAQPDIKTYDGTDSSDETPAIGALETGDTVNATPTQKYDNKNVGTGKTLIASGLVINDGNGGANYLVNYVSNVGVIEAKELTVTGAVANPKVYEGLYNVHGRSATVNFVSAGLVGVIGGEEGIVSLDSSGYSAAFDNKNVGVGKIVTVSGLALAGDGAANYSLVQPVLNDGIIDKRDIYVSAITDTKTYDGNTTSNKIPAIADEGLQPGDTAGFIQTYDTKDVGTEKTLMPSGVVIDDNGGLNYNYIFQGSKIGAINPAPLTITADNKTKVYGTVNPPLTASYAGFVAYENESVLDTPVALNTLANETSLVGEYPITASGAADINYDITFESGTLAINQAPLTITADAKVKTYGDPDPELTYQITSGSLVNDDMLTGSLSREVGENVGDYAITSTLNNDNYDIEFISANLTITPRPIIVTAVTDTKTYNGDIDSIGEPTFDEESLQFEDTPNFIQTYNTPDVGDDKILTVSGTVNDGNGGLNYSYDFTNTAIGEITPLEIVITPTTGQTKIYGEVDPIFTYTPTPNLISPDEFTGALSRISGENVGTYAYEIGTLSAGINYTLIIDPLSDEFAITKATPVIVWMNPADIVYGTALSGTELNATADVGGTFVYALIEGTVLNAGAETLSVAFNPTDTLNYSNTEAEVLITVISAPLTVTADNQTKEYGDPDPDLTYTYSELVNGDTEIIFSGLLDREEGEIAGEYQINIGTLLAGSNYSIDYISGTLTIEDTVMPTVVSHTPSLNALNISPTTPIVVTFSEPVDVENGDISFSPAISDGFAIENSETSVVIITPISPLADNTTYTITLNGVADVNGNLLPTYSNIKFTTATNYSINLNANASGWNLISLPVVPSNTAISAVLGSTADNIDAVWTYDPTDSNAVNGWLVYVPGNSGTNNLDIMTAGFGYWISVTGNANLSSSGTLLIAGPTPPPSRSLQAGWNLIGYYQLPNENNSEPANAFASLGSSYTGLWGFDNATGFFKSVTEILPGDAFWISLPSEKIYTPSNIQ